MSKIGNIPIDIAPSVEVNLNKEKIKIKGSLGELNFSVPHELKIVREGDIIKLKALNDLKKTKSLHGLYRQLIFNAVRGVETPWEKRLELMGTGFNVKLQGEDLIFKIGYSHPVVFKKIANISLNVEGSNKVVVSGADKQLVGVVAFKIRQLRKPDAYKGKGIRYKGEVIKLKPGKKVKTATAGA